MNCRLCAILVTLLLASFSKSYACDADEKVDDPKITIDYAIEEYDFCTELYMEYPATMGEWIAYPPKIIGKFENEYNFLTPLEMKNSVGPDADGKKLSFFCLAEDALKKIRIEIIYAPPLRKDGKVTFCIDGATIILEDFQCKDKVCSFKQSKEY